MGSIDSQAKRIAVTTRVLVRSTLDTGNRGLSAKRNHRYASKRNIQGNLRLEHVAGPYFATSAKASPAALSSSSTSCSPCAADTNAASYWLGGGQTPRAIMARWKRAKAAVSDVLALAKSVTFCGVKNHVNMLPTRLVASPIPCWLASRATPSAMAPVVLSSLGYNQ